MRNALVFFTILFLSLSLGMSQSIPNFANLNVENMSDQQVMSLLERSRSLGLSENELLQMAQLQGVSSSQLGLLKERIQSFNSDRVITAESLPKTIIARELTDPSGTTPKQEAMDTVKALPAIFGSSFFGTAATISFEPSFNGAAPPDYRLGEGDQIFIDLYGKSEQYFDAIVSPQGNILLSNIGPIALSGLTLLEAKELIKGKFATVYPNLLEEDPDSFLNVSLGNIRTIRVSITGEVNTPGSYKLSAFHNTFNALYLAGGIRDSGTYRQVKHFRNGRLIGEIDLYDFLVRGNTANVLPLADGDVLLVDVYGERVELKGAVKRPGIFEMKSGETLADLIGYGGGLSENAKRDRITMIRNTANQKKITDIFEGQWEVITPQSGDVIQVDEVLDRFENRVKIKGAVFREGNYSLSQAGTVKSLVERADGLRGDAYLQRGFIVRTSEDLSTQSISFNLDDLISGRVEDIVLQREDVVHIISKFDTQEERFVEIAGEVNQPKIIPFNEGMTLQEAILKGGGAKRSAAFGNVEITRQREDDDQSLVSEVQVVALDENLNLIDREDFILAPFDKVVLRRNPQFKPSITVSIEGEVTYPGEYALEKRATRISELLERSGGLKPFAYAGGATLIRRTENFDVPTENQERIAKLTGILDKLNTNQYRLSENEKLMRTRIQEEILDLQQTDQLPATQFTNQIKNERLEIIKERNGLESNVSVGQYETVGIRLDKILANPNGIEDLLLEEGDIVVVPPQSETVRLRGSVVFPTTLKFDKGRKAKYYVNNAGGFAARAKRNQTYVIYPNGEVARTKSFLFFRNFPKVLPGSDVIVPTKGPKNPLGIQQALAVTSGLATLAVLISQINFQ